MPRLIAMLIFGLAALGLMAWVKSQGQQNDRSRKTYRPRGASSAQNKADNAAFNSRKADDITDIVAMSAASAKNIRDGLTGMSINTQTRVWQCAQCQTLYHDQSIQALKQDHQGQCLNCGHAHFNLVAFQ
jgi:Tfp pilus assembly protein PilV